MDEQCVDNPWHRLIILHQVAMTRIKFVSAKVEAKSARCRFIGSSNLRMKIALVLKAT